MWYVICEEFSWYEFLIHLRNSNFHAKKILSYAAIVVYEFCERNILTRILKNHFNPGNVESMWQDWVPCHVVRLYGERMRKYLANFLWRGKQECERDETKWNFIGSRSLSCIYQYRQCWPRRRRKRSYKNPKEERGKRIWTNICTYVCVKSRNEIRSKYLHKSIEWNLVHWWLFSLDSQLPICKWNRKAWPNVIMESRVYCFSALSK